MALLVLAGLAVLIVSVAWRPHGWGPALGAMVATVIAAISGAVELADVSAALHQQWRAFVTLASVMIMTSAAERLGLLDRLAATIEPRTRGPVRHAFRITYILSALMAAVFSNDAAILLMTPTVLVLLRTVYPRRHPKFLVPFAVGVFASAGVAPLVISNPMNLIFADHAGIGFNAYSAVMIPVAIVGWVTTYFVLIWIFRAELADESPALGAWPSAPPRLSSAALVVLAVAAAVLLAYPVVSYAGLPLWPAAVAGGVICLLVSLRVGHPVRTVLGGVAWPIFPFLVAVFILAIALERVGVVGWLSTMYQDATYPTATIGATSALGSALLNNHPMSVLNAFALQGLPDPNHAHAFAALIGGDLGPRLLPVGSLASLLWYDLLRRHDVEVSVVAFVRFGIQLTIPPLIVSLALLWLIAR